MRDVLRFQNVGDDLVRFFDGNINKAKNGDQDARDYAHDNGILDAVFEVTWPTSITILIRNQILEGERRHDIRVVSNNNNRILEIKNYTSTKVYLTFDVEREARMDIDLKDANQSLEIQWVFLGMPPSQPLRALLEAGGIEVVIP